MDKIKIGIPRALNYYYYKNLWTEFFKYLGVDVIISSKTNKRMIDQGLHYSNDEMCLSLKIYLSHVKDLENQCDYILVPRIDNYGTNDQTCTNFLSLYDLVNNLFDFKIINYNIKSNKNKEELKQFIKIGKKLGFNYLKSYKAYKYAYTKSIKYKKQEILKNYNKLSSNNLKVLIVSHPYNIHDNYIGKPILNFLKDMNIETIMSDCFDSKITNKLSKKFSDNLYWKYSKEAIGSIILAQNQIDGIIFITSFPCGPDSLVNELVIRKINLPYLNLIIDDMDSLTGIYTRIESFVDIIEQKKQKNY